MWQMLLSFFGAAPGRAALQKAFDLVFAFLKSKSGAKPELLDLLKEFLLKALSLAFAGDPVAAEHISGLAHVASVAKFGAPPQSTVAACSAPAAGMPKLPGV